MTPRAPQRRKRAETTVASVLPRLKAWTLAERRVPITGNCSRAELMRLLVAFESGPSSRLATVLKSSRSGKTDNKP